MLLGYKHKIHFAKFSGFAVMRKSCQRKRLEHSRGSHPEKNKPLMFNAGHCARGTMVMGGGGIPVLFLKGIWWRGEGVMGTFDQNRTKPTI